MAIKGDYIKETINPVTGQRVLQPPVVFDPYSGQDVKILDDGRMIPAGTDTNPQNDPNSAMSDPGVGMLPLMIIAGIAFWILNKK